jgi:hypothetical protein
VIDTPLTSPENGLALAEDDFDLDEWLSTGTLAKRAVEIYNDPALVAEYDILSQRLAAAQAADPAGAEETMAGGPTTDILYAMAELHAKWEASKATWTVRALTEDEIRAIVDAHPDPVIPEIIRAAKKPGEVWNDEQIAAGAAHLEAREAVMTERNIAMIALAVTEVRTAKGARRSVTVEQVRRLRARPHGKAQTNRLVQAVESATSGEVEVPRPTLPGRSASDRG